MITIDSVSYDVGIKVLNCKADPLYKFAERTEDGVLHSELIGFYFNYELEAGQSALNESAYDALWLKITEPVESHTIVMPNKGSDLTFSCYFANISDVVIKWTEGGVDFYRDLRFSVIAISPARTP
jgi:hypothetical protein